MGEAATLKTADSIQMLNQLIVKLPDFLPSFLEKLNLYLNVQNWPEVLETADHILDINSECILAIMVSRQCTCLNVSLVIMCNSNFHFQVKILYNIIIMGNYKDVPQQFFKIIEKSEPCSHVFVQWSGAIVRSCQRKTIINECIRAMQIVIDLEPTVNNKLELAYQIYSVGKFKEAIQLYSEITNNDEPVPIALEGLILCKVALNDINVEVN